HPGRRTKQILRASVGVFFILLTTLSFTSAIPIYPRPTLTSPGSTANSGQSSFGSDTLSPRTVGATPLSGLNLPRTVVSSVDDLVGAGGVVQSSPDNLTLYNLGVKMRLLGGLVPHDQLLSPSGQVLSSFVSWNVQANVTGLWIPLLTTSSSFRIIGTNKTGTFVTRTMQARAGVYSGMLKVFYKALSLGPLKWDLEFTPDVAGQYRLAFAIWNLTMTQQPPTLTQLRLSFLMSNYTLSW